MESSFQIKAPADVICGYALFGPASSSLSIWGPSFFNRVHGFTLVQIGFFAGILSVAAGLPGTVLGGVISDRLRKRGRGGRIYFSALCALLSIPLWLMLIYSGNVVLLIPANLFVLAFALIWLGPAATDVADLAGPNLRGLAVSIYFFTVNIVAYGFGSLLIGRLNDWLGVATAPGVMRNTLLICPLACALAALVLWRGGRAMAEGQWSVGRSGQWAVVSGQFGWPLRKLE